MNYIIGIDVGANGGITVLNEKEEIETIIPYGDESLKEIFINPKLHSGNTVCFVEQVHAMKNQGTVSMFSFGQRLGYILGMLDAFSIPYFLVPPQTWKKYFNLNREKQESIAMVKSLYPDVNLFPTKRCRKEHDGMAESLLIALYGKNGFTPKEKPVKKKKTKKKKK